MKEAEDRLLPCGKLHTCEDIWLVDESLPLISNEYLTSGRWAVSKSFQGSRSIPRAMLWESVVLHDELSSQFALIRHAFKALAPPEDEPLSERWKSKLREKKEGVEELQRLYVMLRRYFIIV